MNEYKIAKTGNGWFDHVVEAIRAASVTKNGVACVVLLENNDIVVRLVDQDHRDYEVIDYPFRDKSKPLSAKAYIAGSCDGPPEGH